MFSYVEATGTVIVESHPSWVSSGLSRKTIAPLLGPLLRFYVVETPSPGLSSRSQPVSDYGWMGPWKKPEYLNRKLKEISSNKCMYWSTSRIDGLSICLRKAGILDCEELDTNPIEIAAFYDSKKNQTLSLLAHLRNGFAHGRFCAFKSKGDIWFAVEDVKSRSKNDPEGDYKRLTARILVKNSTLNKWIKLIQAGPNPLS